MMKGYDFSGYATKNDLLCSDGRTIRRDAFKDCDGKKVPLVYNHQHNDPFNVLGHAVLENREDGVYTYGFFNDTDAGFQAKQSVLHGDITGLSIYANNLKQNGGDVIHGNIREVSLVLAGANPGAFIESVIRHGDLSEEEGIIFTGEEISLAHAEEPDKKNQNDNKEGESEMADEKKAPESQNEKTVQDVFDELTEEQKTVVYALIGQAIEDATSGDNNKENDEEGDKKMKHNVFEQDEVNQTNFLSHADMQQIFKDAKACGSMKEAVNNYLGENGQLVHSLDTTGMDVAVGQQTYGFNDASMLFPDPKAMNNPPEWIKRDMGWVQKVMNSVHRTPFSRIKSLFADITEDEARAKGYIKGNEKKEQVFTTLKRATTPQTVYKKQKLDRDDVLDITDFDVVAWIKVEMRFMLEEEIARAILIGDGRPGDSDDKIDPTHIRPIAEDVPLFNTQVKVSVAANADDETVAKAAIKEIKKARKNYKGSGNPTFWTTEETLTNMLLIEDGLGYPLYKTEAELATALRVKEIVTVEPMEGHAIEISETEYPLMGIICNLTDYNVGADKGGQVNMFDDFDIDLNQMKYLIETRCSGALTKPFSALTILLDRAASAEVEEQPAG